MKLNEDLIVIDNVVFYIPYVEIVFTNWSENVYKKFKTLEEANKFADEIKDLIKLKFEI